jgi:hypothetical protein
MILLRSVLGGVITVFVMWFVIVCFHVWHLHAMARQRGATGLGGIAGGWGYLVGMPSTVLLLTAAFGAGLYLTARWIYH